MTFLSVLILFCIETAGASSFDWTCPSDKPYHSAVGCIFECPEPFYINGTSCVSDCNEWFVDESRHCVSSCPINTFYKESLKQVLSSQYLERKCVRCNQPNQFVSNESCVKACPADTRYIDKNKCVNQCPVDRQFKINITLYGLLHYKCVDKCPIVDDENFCRDSCPRNKVILRSSCVEQCPPSEPFLYLNRCATKCPDDAPSAGYDNRTCARWECPEGRPFVVNNTCVEMCPNTVPFILSSGGFNFCVKYCRNKFRFNDHCVDLCPSFTVAFNNTCMEHCPSNTSYSCVVSPREECGLSPSQHFQHSICIDNCPETMLIWNQTCMFSCPRGLSIFGNECTDVCPIDYPYKGNVTKTEDCLMWPSASCREVQTISTCMKKCPANSYVFKNTCLSYCRYHLLQKDNTCITVCPYFTPFITNATVVVEEWSYDRDSYRKVEEKKTVRKCVSCCDDQMLILNRTCVETCPTDYPYIHNRTCLQQDCGTKYSAKSSSGIICTDKCRPQQFVFNKTCVATCPNTHQVLNGTCIEHCPESHALTSMVPVGETCDISCSAQNIVKQCVETCPNGLFEYNNTCVGFCRMPLYTIDNKCVEKCPLVKPYTITSAFTVINWNKSGEVFKKSNNSEVIVKCEVTCPADKVLSGSRCTDHCPLDTRFITNGTCRSETCKQKYKFYTSAGIRCFEVCPDNLFVRDDICYSQCPDNFYALGQNCISECPPSHKLVNNDTLGEFEYNCLYLENGLCTKSLLYALRCLEKCPQNKLLHNNTCADFCPGNSIMFKSTCVNSCPESHPFTQPLMRNITKWKTRGSEWYLGTEEHQLSKCVVNCEEDYPLYFEYSCVESCPNNAPYRVENKCIEMCPGDKLLDIKSNICVNKCADDRGLYNRSCYYNCPEEYKYIYNSQCVSECPSSHTASAKEDRFICLKPSADNPKYLLGARISIGVLPFLILALCAYSRQSCMDFFYALRLMFASEEKLKKIQMQRRVCQRRKKLKKDKRPFNEEVSFHTDNEEIQMDVRGDNMDNMHTREFTRL